MSIPNETKKEFKEESLIEEAFELLEWNKLKVHLASFAQTEIGKKAIRSMGIPTKIEDSQRLLNETKEITSLEQETKTEGNVRDPEKNAAYVLVAKHYNMMLKGDDTPIQDRINAAINGTLEVLPAVTSAILTTIVAFSLFFILNSLS